MDLVEFKVQEPNTCAKCGKPLVGSAYAASADEARSGAGICAKCAGVGRWVETVAVAAPKMAVKAKAKEKR